MKQVIKLTDNAAHRIKEIMSKDESKSIGVRVGVKSGGCAGMSYVMEYAKEKALFRTQRKAVEAGAHGTLDYTIKEGVNKNKIANEKILKSKK